MGHRGYAIVAAVLSVTLSSLTVGCTSSPPKASPPPGPQPAAATFLAAWQHKNWPAMRTLVTNPPAGFDTLNAAIYAQLPVTHTTIQAAGITENGARTTAAEPVTVRYQLGAWGVITVHTSLHLTLVRRSWQVRWTPATIMPGFGAGDRFKLTTRWPRRAQIYAADGTLLDPEVAIQTGLQATQQSRLAGTPRATVTLASSSDAPAGRLATFTARPGTPVRTTIVPAIQLAAEQALSTVPKRLRTKTAALVAVNTRTGAVLAAASVNGGFNVATEGAYPPGSTFKILDSTALIEHGLTPRSAASCPKTITEDGEVFHNAEGDQPVSTLLQAFTESCNTAFIGLSAANLTPQMFPATAAQYGIGRAMHLGAPAYPGSVPLPRDGADQAATAIGQGRVLMSPLDMAMVAAAVDTGTVHAPRLMTGKGGQVLGHLPAAVVAGLHTMMASVVTSGTAAGTGLPSGTFAKTGTAEFGTTKPLKLDAWLVGFHGDIAFAALVVNSPGDGGPTCGPIVASFLHALPAGA